MSIKTIALINALTLVVVAGWAYLEKSAPTALIPVFLGNLIWIFARRFETKRDANAFKIVLGLTALTFIGLIMPLRRELNVDDTMGVIRSGIMLVVTGFALAVYIKKMLDARNNVTEN